MVDQELGVTDDVDEQDMPDLKAEIVVRCRRYHVSLVEGILPTLTM